MSLLERNSLIIGKLLGDGSLSKKRSARLVFTHAFSDKAYADHCYRLLSMYIPFGKTQPYEKKYLDSRTGRIYRRIQYQSRVSPFLTKMYGLWYLKNQKRIIKLIPHDFVGTYFNRVSLALWYQDDGAFKGERIILSCECFSDKDKQFLQHILRDKYKINSQIDCQGRIDISKRSEMRKFIFLIHDLIHPSMERKDNTSDLFKIKNSIKERLNKKGSSRCKSRTTVYLPNCLVSPLRGTPYSRKINQSIIKWISNSNLLDKTDCVQIYKWIVQHDVVIDQRAPLTITIDTEVNDCLNLLSLLTGLEKSALVYYSLISGI